MQLCDAIICAVTLLPFRQLCRAQSGANPENATTAVVRAFGTHDVVLLGEMHGNMQLYEWLERRSE